MARQNRFIWTWLTYIIFPFSKSKFEWKKTKKSWNNMENILNRNYECQCWYRWLDSFLSGQKPNVSDGFNLFTKKYIHFHSNWIKIERFEFDETFIEMVSAHVSAQSKRPQSERLTSMDVQHIHIINRSNWCFCSIQIHNGIECLISKFVISFSQRRTFFEYMCMIMIPISKQHKNHLFYYLKKEMYSLQE